MKALLYSGPRDLRDDVGFCIGHEAIGEVVEVGPAVTRMRTGGALKTVMIP